MKYLILAMLAVQIRPAIAIELKLDDAWLPKLQQLCAAAQYGSRMTAEPICQELQQLAQRAAAEEQKARGGEAAKPNENK